MKKNTISGTKRTIYILWIAMLTGGIVLADTLHVPGDYPNLRSAVTAARDGDTILVATGIYTGPANRNILISGKSIRLISENGPYSCILDAQRSGCFFVIQGDRPVVIEGFTFKNAYREDNGTCHGGAIEMPDYTTGDVTVFNCIFQNNSVHCWDTSGGHANAAGGALYGVQNIYNCLFVNNGCVSDVNAFGGAADYYGSAVQCSFIGNYCSAREAGYGSALGVGLNALNCLFWNNTPEASPVDADNVDFCLIGTNPLFTEGPLGNYYLSQTASGQPENSPAVDAGSDPAADMCFDVWDETICMNLLTTRTDAVPDAGTVDIGFHYDLDSEHPPVPSPTETPFPTTPTPTASPTEAPNHLGVRLWMPSHYFQPGNPFSLSAFLENPGPESYHDIKLFVVLELAGTFYFAPGYSDFDFYTTDLPVGVSERLIVPVFNWPEDAGSYSGAIWYAAMTPPDMSCFLGTYDSWTFGWGP